MNPALLIDGLHFTFDVGTKAGFEMIEGAPYAFVVRDRHVYSSSGKAERIAAICPRNWGHQLPGHLPDEVQIQISVPVDQPVTECDDPAPGHFGMVRSQFLGQTASGFADDRQGMENRQTRRFFTLETIASQSRMELHYVRRRGEYVL